MIEIEEDNKAGNLRGWFDNTVLFLRERRPIEILGNSLIARLEGYVETVRATLFAVACAIIIFHPILLFSILLSTNVQGDIIGNWLRYALFLTDVTIGEIGAIWTEAKIRGKF